MSDKTISFALAYPLDVGRQLIGLGRTNAFAAAADGSLRTYKCGRRRMVSHQALLDYVAVREAASNVGDSHKAKAK